MSYVVMDKKRDAFVLFDRHVNNSTLEIITTVELVGCVEIASEFSSPTLAEKMIEQASAAYDTDAYEVIDVEAYRKQKEEAAKENAQKYLTEEWKKLSPEEKKEQMKRAIDNGNIEELKKFLEYVGDDESKVDDNESKVEED